jgi:hypothetical protein
MRERVASMVATLEWSSGIRSERQDFEKHTLVVSLELLTHVPKKAWTIPLVNTRLQC